MRIDSVSGMPSEVERPATTGAVAAAATEIKLHSNDSNPPVTAVAEVAKDVQAAPNGRGETVWLDDQQREVFRIVDDRSGRVVCQVPSEEVLRVSRNLEDLLVAEEKSLDIKS
jgi:uncharacterized FlaG/YvyC family protein